jgi:hypothetical protein
LNCHFIVVVFPGNLALKFRRNADLIFLELSSDGLHLGCYIFTISVHINQLLILQSIISVQVLEIYSDLGQSTLNFSQFLSQILVLPGQDVEVLVEVAASS